MDQDLSETLIQIELAYSQTLDLAYLEHLSNEMYPNNTSAYSSLGLCKFIANSLQGDVRLSVNKEKNKLFFHFKFPSLLQPVKS
jgi:hypothetical protein